jgi:hypothetical protein
MVTEQLDELVMTFFPVPPVCSSYQSFLSEMRWRYVPSSVRGRAQKV